MSTQSTSSPVLDQSAWPVIASGLIALAVAKGIGRLAFTPLMPSMIRDDSLDPWAEQTGLSRRTLAREFRRKTGLSLGQRRARARVVRALALAADPKKPRKIAASVGYRSIQALGGKTEAFEAASYLAMQANHCRMRLRRRRALSRHDRKNSTARLGRDPSVQATTESRGKGTMPLREFTTCAVIHGRGP